MSQRERIRETILAQRVIAVIREDDPEHVPPLIDALVRTGITTVEITLTTPDALRLIAGYSGRSGVLAGAGSVLDPKRAQQAFDAGAQFYASPCFDPLIVDIAHRAERAALPGALTPNEILAAWRGGADIVKVFPMPADAPPYLRALLAPMPDILLAPSGGITADNAAQCLHAGAAALNVGSWLTPQGKTIEERVGKTERRGRLLLDAIEGWRGKTKVAATSGE